MINHYSPVLTIITNIIQLLLPLLLPILPLPNTVPGARTAHLGMPQTCFWNGSNLEHHLLAKCWIRPFFGSSMLDDWTHWTKKWWTKWWRMVQMKWEMHFLGDLFGPLFTMIHHDSPFNAVGVPWEFLKKGMGFIWDVAMIEMLRWDRSLF